MLLNFSIFVSWVDEGWFGNIQNFDGVFCNVLFLFDVV
jgi:hypothetical protein